MRKAIITGLLLLGLCSMGNTAAVYLTRDTLASATTCYILIDRSLTINNTDFYSHVNTGTGRDTYVKKLEITISSNTTQAKIGWIYSINASSAQVVWFDRAVRDDTDDATVHITREYDGRGLRLSQRALVPDYSAAAVWGVPADLTAVITDEQSMETADVWQTFIDGVTTSPAAGDVLVEVTAANVSGLVDVKIIYEVR